MVTLGDAALKARIDSERNQGRAPDMGWLDHDRLGFNYRLSDIACALGFAQLGRLEEMLAARARAARLYNEALAGVEGLELPCADRDGDRRGWFVFVVQLPPGVDRDTVVRVLAPSGIQSKPYLPAIHLMSFYRDRFGHREGEFPSARTSLRVPWRCPSSPVSTRRASSGSPEVCWAYSDVRLRGALDLRPALWYQDLCPNDRDIEVDRRVSLLF